MKRNGIEFPENYFMWQTNTAVWVPTDWLMRNAEDSCDFGRGFTIEEMVASKARDTGFGHLVQSIMDNGFKEEGAIGYHPMRGEITEGHHRFAAAILLCLPEVPVMVYGGGVYDAKGNTLVCAHYTDRMEDEYPIEVEF